MNRQARSSPEVRERPVRMVLTSEHEYPSCWSSIVSVASKIGCTPETFRKWVSRMEIGSRLPGVSSDQHQRMKELERENRELKRANEILRKAAALFAQAEQGRKRK